MTFSSAYFGLFYLYLYLFLLLFQGIGATPSPDSDEDVSQVSSMSAVLLALPKNPL